MKNVLQTFPQDAPEIERDSLFGPEGSNVQVKNVSLTIPPDALEKELTITIAISWNRSDLPKLDDGQFLVGPVVHCLPHGLYFKRPVKLSFQCEQKVMDMQVLSRYVILFICAHSYIYFSKPNWLNIFLF